MQSEQLAWHKLSKSERICSETELTLALKKSGFPPAPEPKIHTSRTSRKRPLQTDHYNRNDATINELPKTENGDAGNDAYVEEEDGLFVTSNILIPSKASSGKSLVLKSFSDEVGENSDNHILHTEQSPLTTSLAKRNVNNLVICLTIDMHDMSESTEEGGRELEGVSTMNNEIMK
jgi:hypothetical protein